MNFERSKRKKKLGNKTLKEKSIKNINDISNNKKQNTSFNQRNNYSNNNIVAKPQCLYKGPLKYDISVGEEDDIAPQNNQSLFKTMRYYITFISYCQNRLSLYILHTYQVCYP